MDPNANLDEMRQLAAEMQNPYAESYAPDLALSLAELFQALDAWLTRGGFLPAAWQTTRDR